MVNMQLASVVKNFAAILLCLLVLSPDSAISNDDNYLWPLPVSSELTSGFCQWRSGHWHSGIDIRTFGKTGYDVQAIADGHVLRLVTNWRGYGKALYLKLDDGRIAVYAHLQRFTHEIDKYVQEQQIANRRYKTDTYPPKNKFRFKAGDVVAKSGQTGVGAPHLHFEIRDENNQPLSPLTFYPRLEDNTPPVISEVAFRPLSPVRSRINGEPTLLGITPDTKSGRFDSRDTVVIYGPVGVEVECYDRRPGTSRKYSVSKIEMALDDYSDTLFVTAYDTLSFDRWGEVNLEINYSRALEGDRFYHNMYVFPNTEPPYANRYERGDGWISAGREIAPPLAPGSYDLLINVIDASGNSVSADIPIIVKAHPVDLRHGPGMPDSVFHLNTDLEVSAALFDSAGYNLTSLLNGDEARVFWDYLNGETRLVNRFREIAGKLLLLSVLTPDGARFDRILRTPSNGIPVPYPSTILFPGNLSSGPVRSWYDPVPLNVSQMESDWREASETGPSLCFSVPVLFSETDSSLYIDPGFVSTADSTMLEYGVPFTVGGEGLFSSGVIGFADGYVNIEAGDVLPKSAIVVDTVTRVVDGIGSIRAISLSPRDLLLNDFIDLYLKVPGALDTSRTALYLIDDSGSTSYVGGEMYSPDVMVSKLSLLRDYVLLQDTIPPRIWNVSPKNGGVVSKSRPKIKFKMDDELSGIEDDTDVVTLVDGEWAIPEYDLESKWLVTYPSRGIKAGEHTLEITVRDRAGNTTTHRSTFRRSK